MCKIFHGTSDDFSAGVSVAYMASHIEPYSVRLNPFRMSRGKILHRGSFHASPIQRFHCKSCGQTLHFAFLEAKRSQDAGNFFCGKCGQEDGRLAFEGVQRPPISDTMPVVKEMTRRFLTTNFEEKVEETPDVIPQVMVVFDGQQSTLWTPSTPLECEASDRFASKKQFMLPFRLAAQIDAPRLGVVVLARPFAAGWVDSRYFYNPGRDGSTDRFSPGFHQEFPAKRWLRGQSRRRDISV